jgi:signal peptidase II
MQFSKRLLLILFVLVSCVGCDQATKSMAVSNLSESQIYSYLGDTLRLQLTYNQGAFLSLGASLPDALRRSIFTVGIGLLLIGALAFVLFSKSGTFSVVLAVSLFIAGGIGNLMDRICHDGFVVDFLNVGVGPLRTGIFNIADVAIVGGALVLFFFACRKQKRTRGTTAD